MNIHNYEHRLNAAKAGIEKDEDISSRNRKMILDFCNYITIQGLSKARILRYCTVLRQFSKILNKDFDKAKKEDLARVISEIQSKDYSEWTKHTYKVLIRRFYKWLIYKDEKKEYPPVVKWINVTLNRCKIKLPNEGDLLKQEEVIKAIGSCLHIRDKAFISLLWETGARISEIGNLKIKNIVFDQYGAKLTLFGKTGSRKVRIINSTSYLATWIDTHPNKHDADARLWVNIGTKNNGKPMNYPALRILLQRVFERAQINKKCNPHLFRHSRATVMSKHLTEFQMNQYFGWIQGSNMPATYVHLSGRDVDDAILKMNGIELGEEQKEIEIKPIICPRCATINAYESKFCTKCGCLLDEKEQFEMEKVNERKESANKLMEKLLEDRDIQAIIAEKLKGISSI